MPAMASGDEVLPRVQLRVADTLRRQFSIEPPSGDEDLIHETAIVSASAVVASDVTIEPYAVVGEGVSIGSGCHLGAHAVLRSGTELGANARVDSFAVVGGDPQDHSFDISIESGVRVGRGAIVREGVTIHRASTSSGFTEIGERALLMAHSHVAHDCRIGESAVLANNVMLAGHVVVGAHAFLSGGVGVHQHVRVGEGVMIGGNASVSYDVPPFTLAAERNLVYGLNQLGLRRRNFSTEEIADLKQCYRAVLVAPGDARINAAAEIEAGRLSRTGPGSRFLDFFAESLRGFVRARSGLPISRRPE